MVLKTADPADDADYAFDNPLPSQVPLGGWEAHDRQLELQRDLARETAASWRWRVLGVLTLTVIAGWCFRWETASIENHNQVGSAVLMVNRWTGEMRWVQSGSWVKVEETR
jgi:hypothetical protein